MTESDDKEILRVNYYEDGQVRSIVKHAKVLRSDINTHLLRMKKESKFAANKVDIIAHSMGGLLTREYCKQFDTECQNKIRRFVTIDTPHFGSELADLLLVYRDDPDNFPGLQNGFPKCRGSVRSFVGGGEIDVLGVSLPLIKEPHPIGPNPPVKSAIDDLATGTLPTFIQSSTARGRWAQYPSLSETLSAHAIIGITPQGADGYDQEIWGVWQLILRRCGFTPENVFGDGSDRIVRTISQQGGLANETSTQISEADHFSIRNKPTTIDRIKQLLDAPSSSGLFSR